MQGPKWKKTKMQGLKVHLCLIIITTTTQTKKEKQYLTYAKNKTQKSPNTNNISLKFYLIIKSKTVMLKID